MTKKFFGLKWEGMFEIGHNESVPIFKKLTPTQFSVLCAVAMTQGEKGITDITQEQILKIAPIKSNKTVIKALTELIEFTYAGEHVLVRTKKAGFTGKGQYFYKVLPNPLITVFGEKLKV